MELEEITLTQQELCFAIVHESHSVASESLSGVVVSDVKASNPENWKEVISSRFSDSLKFHLKQRLENNLPLTDFYAVCRLLRLRINDVARYYGVQRNFADAHSRERLCLQVQGVEMVRQWIFHSDQHVSAGEVCSSVALLRAIDSTLRLAESQNVTTPISKMAKLSRLHSHARTLTSAKAAENVYAFHKTTIAKALLYGCLKEFEDKFKSYFNKMYGAYETPYRDPKERETGYHEFPRLMKRIKKSLAEKKKEKRGPNLLERGQNVPDYPAMCQNVLETRNALAHNESLTIAEIEKTLCYVQNILSFFSISHDKTDSAVKAITTIPEKEDKRVSCILMSSIDKFDQDKHRIPRPKSLIFVGRVKESSMIKSVFARRGTKRSQAVLIFGPAGIGKSFLANEIVHELANTYRNQAWLSCSRTYDLEQDLQLSCEHRSMYNMATAHSASLLVLDDVRSTNMHTVLTQIHRIRSSVIITTRSSLVKQFLQHSLHPLTIVDLKPFSLAESCTLVQKKVDLFKIDLSGLVSMKKSLSDILGNLPLCVGIYSSLLAFFAKRKSLGFSNELHCVSAEEWMKTEGNFGDHYHIRGLTGIVQSAEYYLEDHPLVVFLLMKIVSLNSTTVLWETLTERESGTFRLTIHPTKKAWLDNLLFGLLGVTDWMFSKGSQKVLVVCRNTLEELGLISCNSTRTTVSIHRLTLEIIQDMLKKRHLYLDVIIRKAVRANKLIDSDELKSSTLLLSLCISAKLLICALDRSMNVILQRTDKFDDIGKFLGTIPILMLVVNENAVPLLKELLTTKQLELLHSHVARNFLNISAAAGLYFIVPGGKRLPIDHQSQTSSLEKAKLMFSNVFSRLDNLIVSYGKGPTHTERGNELFDLALLQKADSPQKALLLSNCRSAWYLLRNAWEMQQGMGSKMRKQYLLTVLQKHGLTFPALFTGPTADSLQEEIADLSRRGRGFSDTMIYTDQKERTTVRSFCYMIAFRVIDSLEESGRVDQETLEIIFLLVVLLQLRQRLVLRALQDKGVLTIKGYNKQMEECSILLEEAENEAVLWESLQMPGRALRVYVKTYRAIEIYYYQVEKQTNRSWLTGSQLVYRLSFIALNVGWFSGGPRYLKAFQKHVNKTQAGERSQEFNEANLCSLTKGFLYVYLYEYRHFLGTVLGVVYGLCEDIHTLLSVHETFDFNMVLSRLMDALKKSVHAEYIDQGIRFTHNYVLISLDYILILCRLLGQARIQEIIKSLQMFWKRCREVKMDTLSVAIDNIISKLSSLPDNEMISTLTEHFMQSVQALATGNFSCACKASLRSLREIFGLMRNLPTEDKFLEPVLYSMLLRIMHNLRQIYTKDHKYGTVEWLMNYQFQSAKYHQKPFLAGQFGAEYVEFLKHRGRLWEAFEQCCFLERYFLDQFGNDYLEWLPEAPNITLKVNELEWLNQRTCA